MMHQNNKQPALTCEQIRIMEQQAVSHYGISELLMMENASISVSETVIRILKEKKLFDVIIICGKGNNGGDGLAVARHIHNHGFNANIVLSKESAAYTGLAGMHLSIAKKMHLPILSIDKLSTVLSSSVVVVDALFGTGLRGDVTAENKKIIALINASPSVVVAIDVPSGLNADTGTVHGAAVTADVTVTMAAVKKGMLNPEAQKYTGDIVIGNIGIPKELIQQCVEQHT